MHRTLAYFLTKAEAERAAKKYKGTKIIVEQHKKWHTWDVRKVIHPKRKTRRNIFSLPPLPGLRY